MPSFVLDLVSAECDQRTTARSTRVGSRRTTSDRTRCALRLQPELDEEEQHRETMLRVNGLIRQATGL